MSLMWYGNERIRKRFSNNASVRLADRSSKLYKNAQNKRKKSQNKQTNKQTIATFDEMAKSINIGIKVKGTRPLARIILDRSSIQDQTIKCLLGHKVNGDVW